MTIGTLIDRRFRLARLAGRGGMGDVYEAVDVVTGATVALKLLQRRVGTDLGRFEREVRLLASFESPRIVRHIAHGTDAHHGPYLAMEWLMGEDLATRLARSRLTASESWSIARGIAEALTHLHDRGVVHRDLKPGNVFLANSNSKEVKLLDFGIAHVDATHRMTMTGAVVGTAGYMAPEQIRGVTPVDARADVFAAGCIFMECLTGEPPYQGSQILALLTKILFDDPPRLGERCPSAPDALVGLLDRLLCRDPAGRLASGQAVLDAMDAIPEPPHEVLERAAPAPPSELLTDSEQRGLVVLLIAPPPSPRMGDPDDELDADARHHGAAIERLPDGSVVMMLWSTTVATDLVARAAGWALGIADRHPSRAIAMAIGRSQVSDRLPLGAAVERVTRLMDDTAIAVQTGTVVVDEVAAGLLDGRFEVQRVGGAYHLIGERDHVSARRVLGRETPCVGRERELRALEGLLQDCWIDGGGAQVALVTGDPGIGKSRIGRELVERARGFLELHAQPKWRLWTTRCDMNRAGSAFAMLAGLTRSALGLRGGEHGATCRAAIDAALAELPGERRRLLAPFLGELIGVAYGDEADLPLRAARRDPALMNEHIRRSFSEFVLETVKRGPTFVLLDDLQWADSPSLQTLNDVLGGAEDSPLFILALARPVLHHTFPGLWATRLVQEFRLRELPARAAEKLILHVLGDATDRALVARMVELSEGNAFFLEELIRASAAGATTGFPETIVAMVESRLLALSDDERRTLRAASIFGERFWSAGVATLTGDPAVSSTLHRLVERELIVRSSRSRLAGQSEFSFRHALLREGAYAMLTDEDKCLGHRVAGEWLARTGEDDPTVLAGHHEQGEQHDLAATQYLRAAERGALAGDTARAIACVGRGLACAREPELRERLLGLSCQVHYHRVEALEDALGHSEELLRTARPGSAPWAQAILVEITAAVKAGRMSDFQRAVGTALSTEFERDALDPASLTLATICYLMELGGALADANATFARFDALLVRAGDEVPSVTVLHLLYGALRGGHMTRDPGRGLALAREARALASAIGHRKYATMATLFEALNQFYLGDSNEAERLAASLDASADESGFASATRPFMLAWLKADRGQLDEARRHAEALVTSGRAQRLPLDEARGLWVLAEVERRAGRIDPARDAIAAAIALLSAICPLDLSGALATSAAIELASGSLTSALTTIDDARSRATAIGACSQFFRDAFLARVSADVLDAADRSADAAAVRRDALAWIARTADLPSMAAHREHWLVGIADHVALRSGAKG